MNLLSLLDPQGLLPLLPPDRRRAKLVKCGVLPHNKAFPSPLLWVRHLSWHLQTAGDLDSSRNPKHCREAGTVGLEAMQIVAGSFKEVAFPLASTTVALIMIDTT